MNYEKLYSNNSMHCVEYHIADKISYYSRNYLCNIADMVFVAYLLYFVEG